MTAYVLRSTRYHGALIKDTQSCAPKLFNNRLRAWWFKARRRKWHWQVVLYNTLPSPSEQRPANERQAALRVA
jgi:hypothetical protein